MTAIVAGALMGLGAMLHCVGMCGPIASMLNPTGERHGRMMRTLIVHHTGRTLTYVLLGLILSGITDVVRLVIATQVVSLVVGGVFAFLALMQIAGHTQSMPDAIARPVLKMTSRTSRWLGQRSGLGVTFLRGALNGLLPCGVSLAAIVASATLTLPAERIAFLVAFGVVTTPALVGFGVTAATAGRRWQRSLRITTASVTLLAGIVMFLRGMGLGIPFLSPDLNTGNLQHQAGCCSGVAHQSPHR